MRRQLGLLELGFQDLRRHVDVLDGAAENAAELLCELGHRQRLGAGELVDLADMRFRVGQYGSGGSSRVFGGDRRRLAITERQADGVVLADVLGQLLQEYAVKEK